MMLAEERGPTVPTNQGEFATFVIMYLHVDNNTH